MQKQSIQPQGEMQERSIQPQGKTQSVRQRRADWLQGLAPLSLLRQTAQPVSPTAPSPELPGLLGVQSPLPACCGMSTGSARRALHACAESSQPEPQPTR